MDNQGQYNTGYDDEGGYYGGGPQMGYPDGYEQEGQAYCPADASTRGMFVPQGYEPGYGMEAGMDPSAEYYPRGHYEGEWDQGQETSHQDWKQQQQQTTKSGSYYFHSEFTPQFFGYPVTCLAYDSTYEAMYVASPTQSMTKTRWRSHRASLLATHSTTDGMLYSSVAGHPEASTYALSAVYECMYGIPKMVPLPPSKLHVPSHAYRPPYGGCNVDMNMGGGDNKQGHIGITTLLPLPQGYVGSVSPSGVRIHSHGGLQLHDHDIEGMLCGTIHPHSDEGMATHISVAGIPFGENNNKKHEVHCMDLWQGLRVVASRAFNDAYNTKVGVTCLATSHERGAIVAGCSDGNIRIMDGSLRELATIKSHSAGVSSMAVSKDGMLIATTGYGSRLSGKETSVLYAFSDPTVFIYDIRYLGRGGIQHAFAGMGGGPHFLSFMPGDDSLPSNRLMVGSGQPGGGLQILTPFETQDSTSTEFLLPQFERGESISAMVGSDGSLALGTSTGRVLEYKLKGYKKPKSAPKQPLEIPPFVPPMPPVSFDPSLLQGNDPNLRNGATDNIKSLFSAYILQASPKLTAIGNKAEEAMSTFGTLGGTPVVATSRRSVAQSLIHEAATDAGDFMVTIPTSKLELDLLANHNPTSKRYRGKHLKDPIPNPNKMLFHGPLSSICYEDGPDRRRKAKGLRLNGSSNGTLYDQEVPIRYRLKLRPSYKSGGAFDPAEFNNTGLFPGWDYSPTMPNAFASPVLLLLYFVPEVRTAVLGAQYHDKLLSSKAYDKAVGPELGFVFHQIECLSQYGLIYPAKSNVDFLKARVGAWVPSNFLTALSTMPEAEQLQILDGSPAAVDSPRRPEAFYRFLAYQLDKELSVSLNSKIMDSLSGIDFVCINQFISGSSPSSQSSTRALTLDLAYEFFYKDEKKSIRFGEVLQHAFCRETRLRAWNAKSKAYETIVQRKIVTSLPQMLTLACSCAGRKEEDGLWAWRTDEDGRQWLPEMIEVELKGDGNVVVKECAKVGDEETWTTFKGKSPLPESICNLVADSAIGAKLRYRLDAVLSFVRDDSEANGNDENPGHHVLHARISLDHKRRLMKRQQEEAAKMALHKPDSTKLVLTSNTDPEVFRKRYENAARNLIALKDEPSDNSNEWVLFNGFLVSNTVVEDARAFHIAFKEPCLVVFRAVPSVDDTDKEARVNEPESATSGSSDISQNVMNARCFSNNKAPSTFTTQGALRGKLIAFDAEFVSVQEEESTLTETGTKVVSQETRHALARISIINCDNRTVMLDDHVLPREPVVDYLTRFSGIVAQDLDPTQTIHNLISTRSAYLKLRYLQDQGCIFVGHGLRQDFATVNIAVPPNQILDTVEIFHQPGVRYISLRFLANHVLGRDMQQDTHDSVEDALAAFGLYEKALEWKSEGIFDKRLQQLYTYGQKTDWKIGV
jgi:PAB-dependent poly(A)-specific ribonuclease subunit 2